MRIDQGFSYEDVLLKPAFSLLKSRQEPIIGTKLAGLDLTIPILSSPMDTVTDRQMAIFIGQSGGLGVIHRYMSIKEQVANLEYARRFTKLVGASVGVNGDALERVKALEDNGVALIVIDVAHGDSILVLEFIETVKNLYGTNILISSGNIATSDAAKDSLDAGADILRVGIGAGSACTTRIVAGVGVPQLMAIDEIRNSITPNIPIIADGGIRNSGDIVKALAAGADAVMLGGMLASYPITPMPGVFRGMASISARVQYKKETTLTPEGEEFQTEIIDNYHAHFNNLVDSIRIGFAYLGANNIRELRENAEWVSIGHASSYENGAHFGR